MSSPFQKAFMDKSPVSKHKDVAKLLRQAKRENGQDRDYERIADLETELANSKKAHKNNSSKDQINLPSTEEDQQSTINMNYEEKKTDVSPLGNYANPRGEQYISNQPAMQQLQNDLQFLGDSIANESSANKAARLQGRVDRREKRTTKEGKLRGDERATFDADGKRTSGKTFDIQQRAIEAGKSAISQAKAKAEANDNFNKWLNDPKNAKASDAMIEEQKKLAGL